jgi:hypothetical protein
MYERFYQRFLDREALIDISSELVDRLIYLSVVDMNAKSTEYMDEVNQMISQLANVSERVSLADMFRIIYYEAMPIYNDEYTSRECARLAAIKSINAQALHELISQVFTILQDNTNES